MEFKLLRISCVLVLFMLAATSLFAQPFRQLTPADFRGYPKVNNRGVVAYTNCTIDFHFQASHEHGQYRLNFTVRLNMNNDKSWINQSLIGDRANLAEILKHEQGHYNIAYLEQQEVLRTMSRSRFTANYQQEAMAIFNQIDAKYKQLNLNYDADTEHSTNKQQQKSWDTYFAKRLEFAPPVNAGL
ncbi:DUF922 domain-containing protein [Mucilaginibacter terrenus]|uniref:DUF922 domain-containing protein n=1 Tax=Mucilaginibacter terrenus TaxID=2482727 RepID=A0A3E2NQ56_9SPHI|nr:DUF922 domain-containing protein [Mucilaginibacter terrenus]RFZ83134.1 DUF922 domain-containing protein [Mucilaginibacter terrenus]